MKFEKILNALKKRDKYNLLSGDNLIICVVILLAIALWTYLIVSYPNRPDTRPRYIRDILESQLNNTDLSHIDFEYYKTIDHNRTVFRSSEPIFFYFEYVEYWMYTYKPNMGTSMVLWLLFPDIRTVEPFIE